MHFFLGHRFLGGLYIFYYFSIIFFIFHCKLIGWSSYICFFFTFCWRRYHQQSYEGKEYTQPYLTSSICIGSFSRVYKWVAKGIYSWGHCWPLQVQTVKKSKWGGKNTGIRSCSQEHKTVKCNSTNYSDCYEGSVLPTSITTKPNILENNPSNVHARKYNCNNYNNCCKGWSICPIITSH